MRENVSMLFSLHVSQHDCTVQFAEQLASCDTHVTVIGAVVHDPYLDVYVCVLYALIFCREENESISVNFVK